MDLLERLRKRASEDQACADDSRVVAEALSEQMHLFEARQGHNVYAVRLAVDHRKSVERDAQYAADLREAADLIEKQRVVEAWIYVYDDISDGRRHTAVSLGEHPPTHHNGYQVLYPEPLGIIPNPTPAPIPGPIPRA